MISTPKAHRQRHSLPSIVGRFYRLTGILSGFPAGATSVYYYCDKYAQCGHLRVPVGR
jgi:hypothetical protein